MNVLFSIIRNCILLGVIGYHTLIYSYVMLSYITDGGSGLFFIVTGLVYIFSLSSLIYLVIESLYILFKWFESMNKTK